MLGVAAGGNHEHQLDAGTRAAARGARVVALTLPQGMRIRLSFHTGFVLDGLPGWRETFALPIEERMRVLSDPRARARLDEQAHSPEAGVLAGLARWERLEIVEGFTPETDGRANGFQSYRAEVWRDPRAIVGGSDAGAHLDTMSGASYSTFVVGDAVRNGHVTIEEAALAAACLVARGSDSMLS